MNAAGVCKGVTADDSLVGLYGHVHQTRYHAARGIYLCRVDIRFDGQSLVAFQYHGNLFERRVAGTLTNAVNGHLYLAGTVQHAFECVGSGHAEVVMAVGGDDCLVDAVDMLHEIAYFTAKFIGKAIACRVGNVHHGSTGLDDDFYHLGQILIGCPAGILGIELYVFDIFFRIFHGSDGPLDYFLASGIELVMNVRVACSYAGMYALVLGIAQRFGGYVDVALHGTCQGTDSGPGYSFGNLYHRIEIAGTADGKACLYDVDS